MQPLSPAQAEEALTHLTHHFAQWRQSRRTPRGTHSPGVVGAGRRAHGHACSVTRVAKQLGLTPHALKRRRDGTERHARATAASAGPALCRSRAGLADARRRKSKIQRPDGHAVADHVQ